ncbi:MAG: sugar ABC transporter permease [Lachnospiraceae bacterium]|jgi:multiple sugar transport system permease protein|nr:sugar ABC transporter permease [Lachnospiraceae bacterium]
MNRKKEMIAGFLLIAPSILLIVLLIGYPMIYNFMISFHKVPVNPKKSMQFVGFGNFTKTLADPSFYSALMVTLLFTVLVVFLSTAAGLAVAILLNRRFFGKKIIKALILLPYIVPSVSLIFAWKYMFNNTYGIVNYLFVDVLKMADRAPLWFDRPISAFVLVTLFCVWKFFPYAFMSFYAILQTIDKTLYEAADVDGANGWQKFKVITLQEIMPVLATVVTLRTIWVFYMYTEVALLSGQVKTISVYLYENAFSMRDMGKAAAISILLFAMIFGFIMLVRKKVFRYE